MSSLFVRFARPVCIYFTCIYLFFSYIKTATKHLIPFSQVKLLPPIIQPEKVRCVLVTYLAIVISHKFTKVFQTSRSLIHRTRIYIAFYLFSFKQVICVGLNYADHCSEQNIPVPKEPVIFSKFPSCIIGTNQNIPCPAVTNVRIS